MVGNKLSVSANGPRENHTQFAKLRVFFSRSVATAFRGLTGIRSVPTDLPDTPDWVQIHLQGRGAHERYGVGECSAIQFCAGSI